METRTTDLRDVLSLLVERGPLTLATMAWGRLTSDIRRRLLTGRDNVSIAPGVDVERGVKIGYEGPVASPKGVASGGTASSPRRGEPSASAETRC